MKIYFIRDGGRLVLYMIGWIIFVVSVVESFIGYILVWGNMSYWGASVIINILAIIPLIGINLVNFIWCSSSVVLNFAITIHFLIGLIIIFLIILHILYLHNISSNFPYVNSKSSFVIPFFPIFFKDIFVIIIFFLFCSYNFFFEVESIYGNVQNLILASPTATPIHILPEWYFLLFYSILRAFPSKIFGAIMVFIFFIFIIKTPEGARYVLIFDSGSFEFQFSFSNRRILDNMIRKHGLKVVDSPSGGPTILIAHSKVNFIFACIDILMRSL